MTETWRAVVGFEGRYEVSDAGRVRSVDQQWEQRTKSGTFYTHRKRGRVLRPGRMTQGHLSVALGRGNSRSVHVLVLEAFIGPAPTGQEARHLDGIESNNRLSNLKWDTRGNNSRDKKWHRGARSYKLRPPAIAAIKRSLTTPYFGIGADLAAEHGVSPSTISCVKTGKIHGDVL